MFSSLGSVIQRVAAIRSLPVKAAIKHRWVGYDRFLSIVHNQIGQDNGERRLQGYEMALQRFGLLNKDQSYKDLVVRSLAAHQPTFYDSRGWFLFANMPTAQSSGREFVEGVGHALLDQNFDIRATMASRNANRDAALAFRSLVVGDVANVVLEFLAHRSWMGDVTVARIKTWFHNQSHQLRHVPPAIREDLLFPYIRGIRFVGHFRKQHSWGRINDMYKRPPLSSEHILHPEKYRRYEEPHSIVLGTPLALHGYDRVYANVFGEFGFFLLLRNHGVAPDRASRAAAGWGGDQYAVYSQVDAPHADTIGILVVSFDAVADAIEAFEALSDGFGTAGRKRYWGATTVVIENNPGGPSYAIKKRRERVLLIVARSEQVNTCLQAKGLELLARRTDAGGGGPHQGGQQS